MSDEYVRAAETVEALGLVKTFQAICDSYNEGKKIKRDSIEPLIQMKLVVYERGKALATHRGMTVSTRLIVRAAQRNPAKPGHWRS